MHNLTEFLQKYHYWFLFLLLEIFSIVLLFQYNSYQGSVWFTSANYISGKVYEASSRITQYFALVQLNEELTERNVILEKQIQGLTERLNLATGDTIAANSVMRTALNGYRTIPAHVISKTIDRRDNLFTIDRGTADGVRPNMGVASGNGIVGIVYQCTDRYSVVIPLLSSQSSISCTIKDRDYFGTLRWDGRSSRYAYVEDVPRHAHFKLYDKVVTSGYSSVFPPGLLVGKILHVYNSPDGLSYRLSIELSTDFGNLRNVCVIDDKIMQERLEVLRTAEDSLKIKKED